MGVSGIVQVVLRSSLEADARIEGPASLPPLPAQMFPVGGVVE
jgi:hypothetical protein